MRVDDNPAVLPEKCRGQIVESRNDLPISLSRMHAAFSPAAVEQRGGGIRTAYPLVPRDVLAASCALSALCLLQVWFCYLPSGNSSAFYYQANSTTRQFGALLITTTLLTGVFAALWMGTRAVRRHRAAEVSANLAFLLFLAIPANAVRGVLQPVTAKVGLQYWRHVSLHAWPPGLRLAAWGALFLLLAVVICFQSALTRLACRLLILLFPLVPCMLAEAAWVVVHRSAAASPPLPNTQPAAHPGGALGARVVWIIFDEMDYRLTFERENPRLTEFTRLASESLCATRAYPPGGRTMVSVPALLAGRFVTSSNASGVADLQVRYQDEPAPVRWSTGQTVFAGDGQTTWRSGVAGWYFPYARVFGASVEAAQNQTWRLGLNPNKVFSQLMLDQLRVLAQGKSQSLFGSSLSLLEHQRIVGELTTEAIRKASDPALDLVFLHLPVPHGPFYYDAQTDTAASRPRSALGYLDHLQLADHVLGSIRRAMAETGVANRTALLVSSDHWNRDAESIDGRIDHRVPFLLNLPADAHGLQYSSPFNTVLSRALLSAVLKGRIRNSNQATAWLEHERGAVAESPYNAN